MRYKRILLVNIKYRSSFAGKMRPPIGLGYLSEMFTKEGIDHQILDMNLGYTKEDLIRRVKEFQPDLIGYSIMTFRYKETYELIEEVKAIRRVDVVVGGAHSSTFREKVLEECLAVDYGVVLEGEWTLLELCQGRKLNEIAGIIYRENSNVIYNGDRPLNKDLDRVPYPKYMEFELDKYVTDDIPVIISRGCPYSCTYCPVKDAIGKKYRVKSPKRFAEELKYFVNKGYRSFVIQDDNFALIKSRIFDICDAVENAGLKDLEFRVSGMRADHTDRKILRRMKDIGVKTIAFGIESGSNKVLKLLKKGVEIDVAERTIKQACELDFKVILFFLVGSPGETWDDIMASVNLALKYPIFDAWFFNIIPYPRTELYSWLDDNNYFLREAEDYLNNAARTRGTTGLETSPVFATPELSIDQRVRALEFTRKIRNQVRRNYYNRKLAMFGAFGRLASYLFLHEKMEPILKQNRVFRQLTETAFNKVAR